MDKQMTVVIADDTEDLRVILRMTLEIDGRFAVVGEAGTGTEAIAAVAETKPCAIVLDLSMPEMDGFEAIPHLRAASPGIAIAVLSGFAAKRMGGRAMEMGADIYLEKGVAFDELADRLAGLCEARRT